MYKILIIKSEGKRALGKPRHTDGKNIIKINLTKIGWEGMEWIHLAEDKAQCRVTEIMVLEL